MNTCNQCGKSWENPFAKLKHFCRPEIDKSWKEFDTSEGSKSQATDIIKQIQEALEHYANQGDFVRQGITCNDEGRARVVLKLIPSLLEQTECQDKCVSLTECADEIRAIVLDAGTARMIARLVLDKAGVIYAE